MSLIKRLHVTAMNSRTEIINAYIFIAYCGKLCPPDVSFSVSLKNSAPRSILLFSRSVQNSSMKSKAKHAEEHACHKLLYCIRVHLISSALVLSAPAASF